LFLRRKSDPATHLLLGNKSAPWPVTVRCLPAILWSDSHKQATTLKEVTMNRRLSIAMLMLVLLALAAFGGQAILGQAAERNAAAAASTVEEFYRWYLA